MPSFLSLYDDDSQNGLKLESFPKRSDEIFDARKERYLELVRQCRCGYYSRKRDRVHNE